MSHLKETELLALAREPGKKRPAHLATCPACREKLAATERLLAHVQAPFPLPGDLNERTFRALPAPKPTARPLWKPLALGTAIAALAGVGVFALLPGGPVRPTPSFAQVEKAMREVNTATWTETTYSVGADGKERDSPRWECWAQVDSARIARRPEKLGEGWEASLVFTEGDRAWYVRPQRHQWLARDAWGQERKLRPSITSRELVREHILFPRDPSEKATHSDISNHIETKRTAWKSAPETKLLRFVREETTVVKGWEAPPFQITESVWVEPKTYRIVRRERLQHVPATWKGRPTFFRSSRQVSENYRYDEAPPPGTFSVPLPKVGEPFVFDDNGLWKKGRVPNAADGAAMRKALAQAADAWKRRDVKGFLACWDWKSQKLILNARMWGMAPEEQTEQSHWRKAVAKGYPFPRWEVEKIRASFMGNGVYVRKSESDLFPPSTDIVQSLGANGTARVTDAQGKKWRVQLSANFQRQPDGTFKLTSLVLSPRRQAKL